MWLIPHINTLIRGSLARNNFVFWGTAFNFSCFRFCCFESFVVAISVFILPGVCSLTLLSRVHCWCHLSAGTCRLTGQIRQLLLALLTDEATQNQHPKWRRKQMDIPTCFFKRKITRGRWCTWLRGRCMTFSDKPSTVLLSKWQ